MTENEEKTTDQLAEEMHQAEHPLTHEDVEAEFSISPPEGSRAGENTTNYSSIAAIIATSVIILGCIFSCTVIVIVFLINAPW